MVAGKQSAADSHFCVWGDSEPVTVSQFARSPDGRTARMTVAARQLADSIDYSTECVVRLTRSSAPAFTGFVMSARLVGDHCTMALGTPEQILKEQRVDGLTVAGGSNGLRVIHSILRMHGIPDHKIRMSGYSMPSQSTYRVTIPLLGESFAHPIDLGAVRLTSESLVRDELDDMPNADDNQQVSQFKAASGWAVTEVRAQLLWDAELIARDEVEQALGLLAAARKFGRSHYPDMTLRPLYVRKDAVLSAIHWVPLVHVRALPHGDRWFRGTTASPQRKVLDNASDILPLLASARLSPQERAAFVAYMEASAAFGSRELVKSISALWRAIELYTSGIKVGRLFSDEDKTRLKKALPDWATADQRKRLQQQVESANDTPLVSRLRKAAERDNAPLSREDVEALLRTRGVRNDVEHGRVVTGVGLHDIERSLSLVNSLLVYRGYQKGGRIRK